MRVVVAIPYIPGCPWRSKALEWVSAHYQALGVPVVIGHDASKPANRSRARNNAARGVDADVVFFADGDMWVGAQQMHQACETAYRTGCFTLAYDTHVKLNRQRTQALYDGQRPALIGQTIAGMSSGAHAVPADLFAAVGGYDERFRGWGGEDRSFQFACSVIGNGQHIVPGASYHLYHPRSPDFSRNDATRRDNLALALRYKAAAGVKVRTGAIPATRNAALNVDAMHAILSEDGGPLGVRSLV